MLQASVPFPVVIEKDGSTEKVYDLYSRLLKDRIIFVGTPINDVVANIIIAQLLFLEGNDPKKDIYMYINSPGGSVSAGLGIYDTMRYIKPSISTVCVGRAASMGCFLLAAGTHGRRYALPHSRIMMHQVQGGQEGAAPDVALQYKEMMVVNDTLMSLLAEHTGQDIKKVREDFERDRWLSATEAKEYGIVDAIHTVSMRESDE
jgi:ATP-dependent Clp protease protease subunit